MKPGDGRVVTQDLLDPTHESVAKDILGIDLDAPLRRG